MTDNTRFQPGDKVRVKTRIWAADLGLAVHVTYTVAHVDDFGQVALQDISTYYHPSHFELVMRAVADETYCLKDTDGDWWVSDGTSHSLITPRGTYSTRVTPEEAAQDCGIDAEPTAPAETVTDTAPLAVGDWVKVLARVVRPTPDSDGEIMVATTSRYPADVYVRASDITRTDEVPEWAQEPERPEEPTADYAIARDGFRTYVRLPADQVPAFATGKPWALVGTADAYFAWADIEAPTVVKETN